MATKSTPQRYILLPPRGTTTAVLAGNAHLGDFMRSLSFPLSAATASGLGLASARMRVIDSTHENGLKLVEMTPQGVADLRQQAPGVRIVPELFYDTARAPMPQLLGKAKTRAGATPAGATLKFQIGGSGAPVAQAKVIAFTDFANGIGAEGTTRSNGTVQLKISARARIERLYIYPRESCWPTIRRNVQLPLSMPISLPAIDLAVPDVLQFFRAKAPGASGEGVTVGIVDTGCGPHPDLVIAGGQNTVVGENAADYADSGDQHGTHVAGIVAARGTAPAGMAGLAPQVSLRAYRVFPKGGFASNYSIAKAIDAAVADGCDLVNMSLGGRGPADPATSSAIADARSAGVVVLCASGNDGLNEVSQPAADPRAVAVGSFGRMGMFPKDSVSASNVGKPVGKLDKLNFMANFSNYATEIDMVGPGVGVVSTVPSGGWAVMDGTSMACPAATAMVARLLSADAAVRGMARNQERSDAILKMAFQAARSLGFGPQYEGNGWIK
ncbi:MAG: S8 family serine peptidase [Ramlibacter sp.]|nr:S8 family serine peptidase [Ramlibacter sp.]